MAKQQRMMRMEQRSQLQMMEQFDQRSTEELESETKYKVAAQAVLGARAAQKYDAKAARAHFQRALAAATPQERVALRKMADAALALAERRADDLKRATERMGMEAPSTRQLRGLKLMGLLAPPGERRHPRPRPRYRADHPADRRRAAGRLRDRQPDRARRRWDVARPAGSSGVSCWWRGDRGARVRRSPTTAQGRRPPAPSRSPPRRGAERSCRPCAAATPSRLPIRLRSGPGSGWPSRSRFASDSTSPPATMSWR